MNNAEIDLYLDTLEGCLLGGALGDAIGSPIETCTREQAEKYIEDHVLTLNFNGVRRVQGSLSFPFGQVTDDTQLTLDLVTSLIRNRAWEPREYAKTMTKRYLDGNLVGGGSTTKAALQGFHKGLESDNWYEFAQKSDGNGGAMRVAPLAFLYDEVGSLLCVSSEQCRLTHSGKDAILGSQMMALMVLALRKGSTPSSAVEQTLYTLNRLNPKDQDNPRSFLYCVGKILKEDSQERAIKYLEEVSPEGVTGWVVPTMMWALWCFTEHPYNAVKAIAKALSLGGDTDTVASITGQLVGTKIGSEKICSQFHELVVRSLHDHENRFLPILCDYPRSLYLVNSRYETNHG